MSTLLSLIIIGISLSMDAFSVSLSLGTFNINRKKIILICLLVFMFHFILPIIGYYIGNNIVIYLNINTNILLGLILLFISIEMIIEVFNKKEELFNLNIINSIILSLMVSIDSFSTGVGIKAITDNYILASSIFSINALSFTYMGFILGKYSSNKIGIYAKMIGIIILLFLGIIHLLNI